MIKSKLSREEVKEICEVFTTTVLKKTDRQGMCFTLSYTLGLHLEILNVEAKIVLGTYKEQGHYWLELEDGTIVDPTIQQFEPDFLGVYFDAVKNENFKSNKTPFRENQVLETWRERLMNDGKRENPPQKLPNDPPEKEFDIENLLRVNLMAASIIYGGIVKKNNSQKALHLERYLTQIKEILTENWIKNKTILENLKIELPSEYSILLAEAGCGE